MKHSQYEHWILDDLTLTETEQMELLEHIQACESCRKLQAGWKAGKLLLSKAEIAIPADGFTIRWQSTFNRKCQTEKVRRYRLTIVGFLFIALISLPVYQFASGSISHLFANLFNSLTGLFFAISNGLASFGYAINRLPAAYPLAIGFVIFGFINAFFVASMFTLWNIKQKDLVVNEITLR